MSKLDRGALRRGEVLAASAGAALLIAMFLPWYGLSGEVAAFASRLGVNPSANAWRAFGGTDLVLFLAAAAAVALPPARAAGWPLALRGPAGAPLAAVGALASLLVLVKLVDPPASDLAIKYGAILGLLSAAGILAGGVALLREEGVGLREALERWRTGPQGAAG